MTMKAFENAVRLVMVTGGSTNATIHLIAMARAAGAPPPPPPPPRPAPAAAAAAAAPASLPPSSLPMTPGSRGAQIGSPHARLGPTPGQPAPPGAPALIGAATSRG